MQSDRYELKRRKKT